MYIYIYYIYTLNDPTTSPPKLVIRPTCFFFLHLIGPQSQHSAQFLKRHFDLAESCGHVLPRETLIIWGYPKLAGAWQGMDGNGGMGLSLIIIMDHSLILYSAPVSKVVDPQNHGVSIRLCQNSEAKWISPWSWTSSIRNGECVAVARNPFQHRLAGETVASFLKPQTAGETWNSQNFEIILHSSPDLWA